MSATFHRSNTQFQFACQNIERGQRGQQTNSKNRPILPHGWPTMMMMMMMTAPSCARRHHPHGQTDASSVSISCHAILSTCNPSQHDRERQHQTSDRIKSYQWDRQPVCIHTGEGHMYTRTHAHMMGTHAYAHVGPAHPVTSFEFHSTHVMRGAIQYFSPARREPVTFVPTFRIPHVSWQHRLKRDSDKAVT